MHGDTQAVFEFEPPQSVLDEIAADEATDRLADEDIRMKGNTIDKPKLNRTQSMKRKDSMAAVTGFTDHLSEFLHEHGATDIGSRLEAVEASTKRIEEMLTNISRDMGEDEDNSDAVANVPAGDDDDIP